MIMIIAKKFQVWLKWKKKHFRNESSSQVAKKICMTKFLDIYDTQYDILPHFRLFLDLLKVSRILVLSQNF